MVNNSVGPIDEDKSLELICTTFGGIYKSKVLVLLFINRQTFQFKISLIKQFPSPGSSSLKLSWSDLDNSVTLYDCHSLQTNANLVSCAFRLRSLHRRWHRRRISCQSEFVEGITLARLELKIELNRKFILLFPFTILN